MASRMLMVVLPLLAGCLSLGPGVENCNNYAGRCMDLPAPDATILVSDFGFFPAVANISVGQVVRWVGPPGNVLESTVHDVTFGSFDDLDRHKGFNANRGDDWDNLVWSAFDYPLDNYTLQALGHGDFPYYCARHPTMVGTLHVAPAEAEQSNSVSNWIIAFKPAKFYEPWAYEAHGAILEPLAVPSGEWWLDDSETARPLSINEYGLWHLTWNHTDLVPGGHVLHIRARGSDGAEAIAETAFDVEPSLHMRVYWPGPFSEVEGITQVAGTAGMWDGRTPVRVDWRLPGLQPQAASLQGGWWAFDLDGSKLVPAMEDEFWDGYVELVIRAQYADDRETFLYIQYTSAVLDGH